MGIILKQTIKGSIWSYLGILIGFVTTTYLYTNYLTPEVVGLFGLLIAITTITSQVSFLGFDGVTARLFPYFRTTGKGHNGFLFIAISVQIIGFLLFLGFYYFYKQNLIENNNDNSKLFSDFVYLIVPLTFFTMIFSFFDAFNRLLYDTVLGTFLQEFLQRVFIIFAVSLYIFKFLSLDQLIVAFVIAVCLKGIIILIYLLFKGEINLQPKLRFINKSLRKEIASVALFSMIGGIGSMIVFNFDKIAINQMLNLANTGVYTIAFYFGTLVIIPSRPLQRISGTLIAEAWAINDIGLIKNIYYKSCINQFIIGGFLFLGIWANIDNIILILGDDYLQSKWVIFFIGIGYLFDMIAGSNGHVITYSKYYRVLIIFIVILVVFVVGLLYMLIPLWGITGAAIAIAIAFLMNNLMRYLFLLHKFQLQPYNYRFLLVGMFYVALYFVLKLIPQQQYIIDILIRGAIIVLVTGLFIFLMPFSEDIKKIKDRFLNSKK